MAPMNMVKISTYDVDYQMIELNITKVNLYLFNMLKIQGI